MRGYRTGVDSHYAVEKVSYSSSGNRSEIKARRSPSLGASRSAKRKPIIPGKPSSGESDQKEEREKGELSEYNIARRRLCLFIRD